MEYLDIVDENGQPTGQVVEREYAHRHGIRHRTSHVWLLIIEDRHQRRSTMITSQIPVKDWYDVIGEKTIADAVLDRIVHHSLRVELFGESIRKRKSKSENAYG